jgi:pyruvate dehydrogenase E2 component (dihydrolipoamide acetyltransferase)
MSFELTLPQLGLTMTEGIISEWQKKEGDAIAVGDVVFTVENDKSVVEYEAGRAGTLVKILVEEGISVPIKTPVGIVAEAGEDPNEVTRRTGGDKTTDSTPAHESGPDQPEAGADAKGNKELNKDRRATGLPPVEADGFVLASPRARALAAERGVDLATVTGSGPDGVVIEKDIPASAGGASVGTSAGVSPRNDREVVLGRIQSLAAERLATGWQEIPQFTLYQDAPMEALAGWRSALERIAGYKPSMTVLLAKAVASALFRHERLNAHWLGRSRIRVFGEVNIGIAVDTPDGLVVPVLRRCLTSSVERLDQDWRALVGRVKGGKTTSDDFAGAGFTISNLGMFGTDRFRALVNPPQVGILSVGAQKDVVVSNSFGTLTVQKRATIGLSADHRAVDGAYAARFLSDLIAIVENPALIHEAG